jgi:hypothetical protein
MSYYTSSKEINMSATPLSYSSDLTREEILARFRDRLPAGKRSKLDIDAIAIFVRTLCV